MITMIYGVTTGSAYALGALIIGLTTLSTAVDDVTRDPVDQLLDNNPGITREIVIESAEAVAAETGQSREAVIESFLLAEKQNLNIQQEILRGQEFAELPDADTRSSDPGTIPLPTSYYKGDIYYTPVTYYGASIHGHVGIYGDTNWVVEAPGDGHLSDW